MQKCVHGQVYSYAYGGMYSYVYGRVYSYVYGRVYRQLTVVKRYQNSR